jgi:hypothetical protein
MSDVLQMSGLGGDENLPEADFSASERAALAQVTRGIFLDQA